MTEPALLHPEYRRLPIEPEQASQLAALDMRATQAQSELNVALRMIVAQHKLVGNYRVVQLEADALILAPAED